MSIGRRRTHTSTIQVREVKDILGHSAGPRDTTRLARSYDSTGTYTGTTVSSRLVLLSASQPEAVTARVSLKESPTSPGTRPLMGVWNTIPPSSTLSYRSSMKMECSVQSGGKPIPTE